ncbi:serine hydrolase domain-containing protein [Nocardioides sp. Bht2]|uniref:serine hydrolase domain-containing protein n=1 Tax=Nocardioides sp. Bht2 TaxID=3392297 RepID=UPI0039B5AEF6
MSDGALPTTARALRTVLAQAQASGRVPSVVAGVAEDGVPTWCEGWGAVVAGPEETQYRIGSITKTLTAVLILQLVDQEELSLSAPVRDVLGPVPFGEATIADLLSHSSGMPAEPSGTWWERAGRGSFAELIAAESQSAAVLAPGERFHYTNLAYGLLGECVAVLTGQSWMEAVQQRLLDPLAMSRTSYGPGPNAARGYSVDVHRGTLLEEPTPDTGAMAPAGHLWSTVGDLLRWGSFLVSGHPEVATVENLERAFISRSAAQPGSLAAGHGLGFALLSSGVGTLVGHTGSMPGFQAACFVERSSRRVAVVLGNGTHGLAPGATAGRLLEAYAAAEPPLPTPWVPSTPVPELIEPALGHWFWGTTRYEFCWEGAELVARVEGAVAWRYRVAGERIVGVSGYQDAEELRVVRGPDGSVHLNAATFILTRTPYGR